MVARSRTGCLTCRQRKLKCDEQRPRCGQCQKAQRECVPSSGIVFRHQQNASLNSAGAADANSLQSFYAYKNSFTKDSIWVRIPDQVTFVINADPDVDFSLEEAKNFAARSSTPPTISAHTPSAAWTERSPSDPEHDRTFKRPSGLDTLSAVATNDQYILSPANRYISPPAQRHGSQDVVSQHLSSETLETPSSQRSGSAASPPSNSYFSQVLIPSSQPQATPIDSSLPFTYYTKDVQHQAVEFETSHEVTFLLRYFAEGPGPAMDLFDIQRYFTNYVPVKAMTNPILKNATCAYAAKQLSLLGGRKPIMGGAATTQAPSELLPDITPTEWAYKGTQYYDRAIELLMRGIRDGIVGTGRTSPDASPEMFEEAMTTTTGPPTNKRRFQHDRSLSDSQMPVYEWKKRRKVSNGRALSDEITAATAILCDYELQEGTGIEWQRHLDGAKSLLDIVAGSMMPLQTPLIMPRPLISRARQATFWNFARQDLLSAYINEKQTRLDTEDLPMWKDAGLAIDESGFIRPSNVSVTGLPEGPLVMKEDMISNALIWIMGKIVNFAVAGDTGPSEGRASWEGINQAALYQKWSELKTHLDAWQAGLPDSFKPCAQLHPSQIPPRLRARYGDDGPVFTEIWYNIPMCAATMQSYHMARMLLLMNMPQQSTIGKTTFNQRFTSYKTITKDIEAHAHAICGIASSRPESAVRIQSVQPLFTAGQSLSEGRERRELVRLLEEIQTDTGWATKYRIDMLREFWKANG